MGTSRRRASAAKRVASAGGLSAIDHFVVLMLENRSFDHLLGYLKCINPRVAGMPPDASNHEDPLTQTNEIRVTRATETALAFDPGHEFDDVQTQLYGPADGGGANPPSSPAPMSGFVWSSRPAGNAKAGQVMECFEPDQLPALTKLADEFAIFNFWYSPIPGPTWPNRFFVHAGTSGGLFESPSTGAIVRGFRFKKGTIFDRLDAAGMSWRIYHEDFPQAVGIKSMLSKYLSKRYYRQMPRFFADVKSGDLPEYTFIEPRHDPFNEFIDGNSMHPENDVAHGEKLIKDVYEAIRNSRLWPHTMLIITFDEHGGFYDHVAPPTAMPTGDDTKYATPGKTFAFDQYGVRVPTIVVSAYTERQTVIGTSADDPASIFDHCAIPATVRKRYGLAALSSREAKANTLEVALNRLQPRDQDAPKKLPAVPAVKKPTRMRRRAVRGVATTRRPLSKDQETFLALAMAVDAEMNPAKRKAIAAAAAVKRTPAQAATYAVQVQARALARRGEARLPRQASKRKRVVRRKRTLRAKRGPRRK